MTNESLGNVAVYLGEAKVNRYGDVSTLEIVSSPRRSTPVITCRRRRGKSLSMATRRMRRPKKSMRALSRSYGALYETGPNAIITMNQGTRDGVEPGHVMAIYRNLNAPTFTLRESPFYGRPASFTAGQSEDSLSE